jgi:hypothetical protein
MHQTSKFLVLVFQFLLLIPAEASAELFIDSVYPTLGKLNEDLNVAMTGTGFNSDTRASMYPDSGNARLIRGFVDTIGDAEGVYIVGSTAYVTDGQLQIIDISTASDPVIVASVALPGAARDVTVQEKIAYVAADTAGLQIIDVTTPTNPEIVGSLELPDISAGITVVGDTAYLAQGFSGLQIVDISTPTSPVVVGSIDTPDQAYDVAVTGNTAYLADGLSGLQIIDVSAPANPQNIGSVDTPGNVKGVAVVGDTAFVADRHLGIHGDVNDNSGTTGLLVVDISTPADPTIISSLYLPGAAEAVTVVGETAYVADGEAGLHVIDISTPTSPVITGSIDTPRMALDVAIIGDSAYVADQKSGLQVIDISSPTRAAVIGSVDTPDRAYDVIIVDDLAYVADRHSGLKIIDISTSSNPVTIGSVDTPDWAYSVTVVGNTAYVPDGESGLHIVDISTPANPVIIGSLDTPGWAGSVVVEGNIAYLADGESGVQIIDVSTVSEPEVIASVATSGFARWITSVGNFVYIAVDSNGLEIADISTPAQPVIVGSVETPGRAVTVTIVADIAYIADWDTGLQVIDISTPANPVIIGSTDLPSGALGISVIGDKAYIANGSVGLQVVDISLPAKPVIIGSVDTPGWAYRIAVDGDYAYVADGGTGLVVLPLPVELSPVTVSSSNGLSLTLPGPELAGDYTIRLFNDVEYTEEFGAVSFADGLNTFSNPGASGTQDPDPIPDPDANAVSKALILAGGGPYPGNNLWEATINSANFAYKALLYQGYTRENIHFLSPDLSIDSDGDGVFNDIDGQATLAELEDAILNWATDPTAPAYELLVYVVDHGGYAQFRLNETTLLTAAELDGWLDELQQSMPGKLLVVYDACQSGTFISELMPPAGKDRILITSAGDENAFFVNEGVLSFSYQFWASVLTGGDLYDSYLIGRNMMQDFQTAQLDSDGDGIANEKDDAEGIRNLVIGRGYIPASDKPLISSVSEPQTLSGINIATISAWGIIDATGIERVWGVITPPDFTVASPDEPVIDMPTVELTDSDGDNTWEGVYEQFDAIGTYDIIIYAMNTNGFYSSPSETFPNRTTVTQVGAVIDTDGDGLPDELDIDDDNDGVYDVADAFPLDVGEQFDTDKDGVGDNADPDTDHNYNVDTTEAAPITGLWWNSLESGWGVTLTQQYGVIFATLFTYDEDGLPTWYVASNCVITLNECTGDLYEVTGGSAIYFTWNGENRVVNDVGEITVSFQGNDNALMTVTINGETAQKAITRQEFSTLSPGATMSALWWNAKESGWGVTLTQQTNIVFVTIFTYNSDGFPTWYVASNCTVTSNGCSGVLYEVTGGSAITAAWDGTNKSVSEVGVISFDFSADDAGAMSYSINGISGSKDITRQIWATQ